jgi:hypothetical protein
METVCRFLQLAYDPRTLDGWQSTPYTNRGGIQQEKAQASQTTDGPGDLASWFPTAYKRYESLRELCPVT